MLKKLSCVAVVGVLLFSAVAANGSIQTGDNRLVLTVAANGQATISNNTGSFVIIESYRVDSLSGKLNPSEKSSFFMDPPGIWLYTTLYQPSICWASIEDNNAYDQLASLKLAAPGGPGIGNSAGGFVEMSNTVSECSEATGTTGGMIIVYPKGGAAAIPLGKITNTPTLGDLKFYYGIPTLYGGTAGDIYEGKVVILPEPATMCVLALGGVGMLVRRRRRS